MNATYPCVSLSLALLACSSSPGTFDPGAGDDPGSGTATLVVNGTARAEPRVANASAPSDFDTEFGVRLTLANVPITTGTVTLTSASATVALTYRPDANNGGRWEGNGAGYDEVYQLDVDSGPDNIHGVRVDGPDIHFFVAPLAGAVVDSTLALPITWDRGEEADAAILRAGELDEITIGDTGSYDLAPASLKSSQDQSEVNQIRLRRTNRVTPAGAAGGSDFGVSIENELDVVAQPNPNA